jgi:hypothetical protein
MRDFFYGLLFTLGVIAVYVAAVLGLVVGVASADSSLCRTYSYSSETFTSCSYDDDSGHHHYTTTCNQWGCRTVEP